MRVGPSLSAYILCLGGLHLIRSKTVGEQLMNPHRAWLNFFICYDVPGSHAHHGPQIHTCSCRTRERNLPGRRDAVVTTLLILRYNRSLMITRTLGETVHGGKLCSSKNSSFFDRANSLHGLRAPS